MPGGDELYPGLICPPGAKPGVLQQDQVLLVPPNSRLLGQVVDEPLTISKEEKMINLIRATKTTVIETEVLVYPFSSFLAEFGGALGLFVGFSFMVFWDLMQILFNIIFMEKNYNFCK